MSSTRRWLTGVVLALFLAVAGGLIFQRDIIALVNGFAWQASVDGFQSLIRSWGAWGVVGSIFLMVAHSFIPFPAEFLAIANGVVWGPFGGTVITWTGAMLGALATFELVRLIGEGFVRRMVPERQSTLIDGWVENQGVRFFLITRLVPLISFDLLNIAAGLTRMTRWTFLWTTGIGILPMTTLMVVMGDRIHTIPLAAWLLFGLGILILCLVSRRGYAEIRGI